MIIKKVVFILMSLLCFEIQAYSAYSNSELDQLEKSFVQEINQSNSVIRDPLSNEYINHLAKRLATHGELTTPYFFIVKSHEINAFAGPGGYIGVNSQLILASDNESELAAVMAHEMSHVRQHHLYRMIEHQKQMRVPMLASMLASIALGAINPALGSGALAASLTGLAQDSISFTRSNEKEADRIGIDMLIKSGLNPHGMASFFRKMQLNSRYYYTDNIPAILRTHPLDDDRIAEAQNRSLSLATNNHYEDSLDYALFKERIRVMVSTDVKQLLDYYQHQPIKKIAAQYGYSLALLNANKYSSAKEQLTLLSQQHPDNAYLIIAMAQAEEGLKEYKVAIQLLKNLQANHPNDYASTMEYANALLAGNEAQQAVFILLKGSRQFKQDLSLCQLLARAQALNHRKDFAYFTQAQCHLLQGEKKTAINYLNLAKSLAKKDNMLKLRIDAKLEEIKET